MVLYSNIFLFVALAQGKLGEYEDCQKNEDCVSGFCSNGQCVRGFKEKGDDCTSSDVCLSGNCTGGRCIGSDPVTGLDYNVINQEGYNRCKKEEGIDSVMHKTFMKWLQIGLPGSNCGRYHHSETKDNGSECRARAAHCEWKWGNKTCEFKKLSEAQKKEKSCQRFHMFNQIPAQNLEKREKRCEEEGCHFTKTAWGGFCRVVLNVNDPQSKWEASILKFHNSFRCTENAPPLKWDATMGNERDTPQGDIGLWTQFLGSWMISMIHATKGGYAENILMGSVPMGDGAAPGFWWTEIERFDKNGNETGETGHYKSVVNKGYTSLKCAQHGEIVTCRYGGRVSVQGEPYDKKCSKAWQECFPNYSDGQMKKNVQYHPWKVLKRIGCPEPNRVIAPKTTTTKPTSKTMSEVTTDTTTKPTTDTTTKPTTNAPSKVTTNAPNKVTTNTKSVETMTDNPKISTGGPGCATHTCIWLCFLGGGKDACDSQGQCTWADYESLWGLFGGGRCSKNQ